MYDINKEIINKEALNLSNQYLLKFLTNLKNFILASPKKSIPIVGDNHFIASSYSKNTVKIYKNKIILKQGADLFSGEINKCFELKNATDNDSKANIQLHREIILDLDKLVNFMINYEDLNKFYNEQFKEERKNEKFKHFEYSTNRFLHKMNFIENKKEEYKETIQSILIDMIKDIFKKFYVYNEKQFNKLMEDWDYYIDLNQYDFILILNKFIEEVEGNFEVIEENF